MFWLPNTTHVTKINVATRLFDFQSISIAQITISLLVISFALLDETEINWANTIRTDTHLYMSLCQEDSLMRQNFIYNIPFKNSHLHPIQTCFGILASNVLL